MRARRWRPTGPSVGLACRHSCPFTSSTTPFVPRVGPLAGPDRLFRVTILLPLLNHAPRSTSYGILYIHVDMLPWIFFWGGG
jgi:hypothetical protein